MTLAGLRIAVYARFSSDRQRETSIEDQVERARRWASERGGAIAPELVFADVALSGASMARPAVRALEALVTARPPGVDVVLVEDLSRLSRDSADLQPFLRRARFAKVRIVAVDGGFDSAAPAATSRPLAVVHGLGAEMYLEALRDKTLRGMEGRARAGCSTGGLPLGYRSVPNPDGFGRRIEVDPDGAELVRRIFHAYAAGGSYASIAAELSRDGIAPRRMAPHRRQRAGWAPTAIRAILHNPRYSGRWSWGELTWSRDPETGKRVSRKSAPRHVQERPDLVIIDAATRDLVLERIAKAREVYRGAGSAGRPTQRRARHWLAGLLVCGECGAVLELWGPSTLRCSAVRRGVCSATWTTRRPHVSEQLLAKLAEFFTPDDLAWLHGCAVELLHALGESVGVEVAAHQAAADRARSRAERLAGVIADGLDSPTVRTQLTAAEREERAASAAAESAARVASSTDLPNLDEVLGGWTAWSTRVEESPDLAREAMRTALVDGQLRLVRDVATGELSLRGMLRPLGLLVLPLPAPESTGSGGCGGRIGTLPVPESALIPVDIPLSKVA